MATDWSERAFILNTWLLIISSYASILFAMITLYDAYPGAIAILVIYLLLNILYHFAIFDTIEIGYGKVETMLPWDEESVQGFLMVFLCPIIYCEAGILKKISKTVGYYMNGLELMAVAVKTTFVLVLISFIVNVKSDVELIALVLFSILHTVLGIYNYKGIQIGWFVIIMLGPLFLLFILLLCYITITLSCNECLKSRREQLNVVRTERDRRDRLRSRRHRHRSVLPLRDHDSEVQQRLYIAIEDDSTPQNMNRIRYNGPERYNTIKALGKIFTEWKRGNSIKQNIEQIMCGVGLEYFNRGEEVIELKCGIGHIFHPHCIKQWTKRNKTCPVGRTNVVEIAKREHAKTYQDLSVSWVNISGR